MTNQSSEVKFASYVFRLCIGGCALVVVQPTYICSSSAAGESKLFCMISLTCFVGAIDLIVCRAVASNRICILLFFLSWRAEFCPFRV